MSFTYEGDPTASDLDALRFTIGDTNSADPQLSDEELLYLLSLNNGVLEAAIDAVDGLIAKYARLVDKSVDGLKYSYSQRHTGYMNLRDKLVSRQNRKDNIGVVATGISVSDKQVLTDDTDYVQNDHTRGQFDYGSSNSAT